MTKMKLSKLGLGIRVSDGKTIRSNSNFAPPPPPQKTVAEQTMKAIIRNGNSSE